MEKRDLELLEYAKEMAKQAEEIGRLKVLNEIKDKAIEGLQATLGLGISTVRPITEPNVPTIQPLSPYYYTNGPICTSGYSRVSDMELASTKTNLESTISELGKMTVTSSPVEPATVVFSGEEKPKRKCGRPKGSKNTPKKPVEKEVSSEIAAEETSVGGSVFKEFTPLNTENLINPNANAYIPRPKRDNVFNVVS